MFKRFTAALLTFFLFVSGMAAAQENLYVNAGRHYSIQFPANWIKRDNGGNGGFDVMYMSPPNALSGTSSASVSVITTTVPMSTTLNNFVELNLNQLRNMNGFNMNDIGDVVVMGGIEAKVIDYNYQDQYGQSQTVRQYFAVYGGTAYLLTCSANTDSYAEYAPTFASIVGTFRFI